MWKLVERPGYFGKRRDQRINELNAEYGKGMWRLSWVYRDRTFSFIPACRYFYERSYFEWLSDNPKEVDFICAFAECFDNSPSNIGSGLDYSIQEAVSTHIQDIALRNVLRLLDRKFENTRGNQLLEIRSTSSNGHKYGPGNIPLFAEARDFIDSPSRAPSWAQPGSVEDFWQSNKWIEVYNDKQLF